MSGNFDFLFSESFDPYLRPEFLSEILAVPMVPNFLTEVLELHINIKVFALE